MTKIKTIICVGDSYNVNKTYNAIVFDDDSILEFPAARHIFKYLREHDYGDFSYTSDYFPMLKFNGGQRINFFHDIPHKEISIFLDYMKMNNSIDKHAE